MPKFANIEDAPHHLKLLNDYGKTAITLSLALLGLSVTFAEKLIKPPVDSIDAVLLIGLWLSLLLALIFGLLIAASLTAVSSIYMTALRTAYPDALVEIAKGTTVTIGDAAEDVQVDADAQGKINAALTKSRQRAETAYSWAKASLLMFGVSASLLALLGFYSSILKGMHVDASSAVRSSSEFVSKQYRLPDADAQLISMAYDNKEQSYTVKIVNKRATTDVYTITVNSVSGLVTNATSVTPTPEPSPSMENPKPIIVRFNPNSLAPAPEAKESLQDIYNKMSGDQKLKVKIEGHTDSSGKREKNVFLSIERAKSVRNYLVELGITEERIIVQGYGDTKAVADNATKEGRAQNRRVEITFIR
jgi:outer membrane protein OmpA-like peptidoglycan-associated protein